MYWPVSRDMELVPHYGQMRALQKELNRIFYGLNSVSQDPVAAVNIYGKDDEIIVKAELPGVKLENISISVLGESLSITAERKAGEAEKGAAFYRNERNAETFSRSFRMPFALDAEKTDAQLADGILTIKLPRAETSKAKKISVRTA